MSTFTLDTKNSATLTEDTRSASATFTIDTRNEGDYLWTSLLPWQSQFPWLMSGFGQLFTQDVKN